MVQKENLGLIKCENCGRTYTLDPKWEYNICKNCASKKIDEVFRVWATEILGYHEELWEFLPKLPRDLFFLTLKDYVSDNELKQKVDNALRSHPDKRYSSMDLKQIAIDEKDKLLTAAIPSKKGVCEKCNSSYDINGIWPYKICQKCALNEKYKWENIWLSELGYDEEFAGIIPTPPIDTKKYRIDATFSTESSGRGKTNMTQETAARIQSHADRNETNQDFKARAQSAAAKK